MSKRSPVACVLSLVLAACGTAPPAGSGKGPAPVAPVVETRAPAVLELAQGARAETSWLGAAASSEYLLAGAAEHEVGIWIEGPRDAARSPVPALVALSIDTSGSMEGEKMESARRAAKSLLTGMRDGDVASIETFADEVRLLAPPTLLDRETRPALVSRVSELTARGGTNLFEGVRSAQQRAREAGESHPLRRVIVISDGQATVGNTSAHAIGALADLGADAGVQVTALGVGLDYDERALNALAERSNGRLFHIANAADLAGILEKELALLNDTVATRAHLELVPAPGVRLLDVVGAESRRGERGTLSVPLGAMHSGQLRELVVRLSAPHAREGRHALVSARLHFDDVSRGGLARVQEQVVSARFTDDASLVAAHARSRVQAIVARNAAAELAIRAAEQASSGDLAAADRDLEQAERKLAAGLVAAKGAERERLRADMKRVTEARSKARAAASAPGSARPKAVRAGSLEINDLGMDLAGY